MGYYVSSRGGIDLPEASLDAVWADLVPAAAENRVDLADADNWRAEFGVEGMIAVVIAAAIGSDCPRETWERGGNGSTVHLEVWGDGDVGEAMEVLSIVAAGGGTGVIYSDSDGSKWRWRLEDGEAHDETGRTCYGDEVDATAWVVQLQRPGQGDLDRVAVVASEAAATAQLAAWVRHDYPEFNQSGEGGADPIDSQSDAAVLEAMSVIGGGIGSHMIRIGDMVQNVPAIPNERQTQ